MSYCTSPKTNVLSLRDSKIFAKKLVSDMSSALVTESSQGLSNGVGTSATVKPVKPIPNINVTMVQQLLKHQDSIDTDFHMQTKLANLKNEIILEAKKNFVVEKAVETLSGKIRLLIRNQLQTDELKSVLASSFDKTKMKTKKHGEEGLISEEAIKLFEQLFYILRASPKYLATLTKNVKGQNVDMLLQTVVFTIFGDQFDEKEENLLLQLFERVLKLEFQFCPYIGEFMRSNTAFTKMLSALLKRSTYQTFLGRILKDPLQQILSQEGLNLDINPANIYRSLMEDKGDEVNLAITEVEAAKYPEVQALLEPRIKQIYECTEKVLNNIYSLAKETPYGIRYICKRILKYGTERYKEVSKKEIYSLVGGFFFLRFVNPAITICDAASVKLYPFPLTSTQRNNLKMVCKVIQNLSNGVEFGTKEPFMTPLNPFLSENSSKMTAFFESLCQVDEISDRLRYDRLMEVSREAKIINISFNEVAHIHSMLKQNLSLFTEKEDSNNNNSSNSNMLSPLSPHSPRNNNNNNNEHYPPTKTYDEIFHSLLQELDKLLPHLEQVDTNNNYYMNLKLIDPKRESSIEEALPEKNDPIYAMTEQVKKSLSIILKVIPTLPTNTPHFIALIDVLKAARQHSIEKEDLAFSAEIKNCCDLLDELERSGLVAHSESKEKYELILSEMFEELKRRADVRADNDSKLQTLEKSLKETIERREYLNTQLTMFNAYLENILSKTFRKDETSNKPVGPFSFKFAELQKNDIVIDTVIPKPFLSAVTVTFTSNSPGIINVSASAAGMTLQEDFDLSELLAQQAAGQTQIDIDGKVTLNLDMFILWLNKLFVLDEKTSSKKLTRSGSMSPTRKMSVKKAPKK